MKTEHISAILQVSRATSDSVSPPPPSHRSRLLPRVFLPTYLSRCIPSRSRCPLFPRCAPPLVPPELRPHRGVHHSLRPGGGTKPPLLRPSIVHPLPTPAMNGFHRRGPHSLPASSSFLPLFASFSSPFPFYLLRSGDLSVFLRSPLGVPRRLADWLAVRLPDCLPDCKSSDLLASSSSLRHPCCLCFSIPESLLLFYTPLDLHFSSLILSLSFPPSFLPFIPPSPSFSLPLSFAHSLVP